MTDRELLEAAAKAAGIAATAYYGPSDEFWGLVIDATGVEWNPLADDGDALRLAVKLELIVDAHGLFVRISEPFGHWLAVESKGNPLAATRRAIVRAAAAIRGEQK